MAADFSWISRTMRRGYRSRRSGRPAHRSFYCPRYAGITHTSDHILLYEDVSLLGTVLGNLYFLFRFPIPLGKPFLILYGTFSGIFLGGWILALAEMADVFPIFSRRIRLTEGMPVIIIAVALGKLLGSMLFYYYGWQ